ncbi:unnamed protein product [Parajaminaea phylloscopi]
MSAASPFEFARSTHEETERYESALASILQTLPSGSSSSSRATLKNSHLASILVDRIVARNRSLLDFYEGDNGLRKDELNALSSGSTSGDAASNGMDSVLELFQSRLSHIKTYHEKYPAAPPEAFTLDLPALESSIAPLSDNSVATLSDPLDRLFSGEEGAGRYLDLYEQHSQYLNLKGIKRTGYLNYLDRFHHFESLGDVDVKRQDSYRTYLTSLRQYLVSYLRKIRPLDDVDDIVRRVEAEFEEQWNTNTAAGWEDGGREWSQRPSKQPAPSEPKPSSSEAAKDPSSGNGVWCEVCQKSYAKQSVFDGHLNGKNHKKAAARQQRELNGDGQAQQNQGKVSASSLQQAHALAKNEYLIHHLASGPLADHCADTRANVERRATLTERERQAEAEEMARTAEESKRRRGQNDGADNQDDDDDDDDKEDKIYNPKKLPLGWDGRPIPVWLYKLHGLGVEFRCEICSDFVYQGRKNFDRHFTESRHAFGMRALGLPNTKHFHGVTSIEDAMHLADKLKKQGKEAAVDVGSGGAGSRDVEEVEDESGNTYSRRDYELLKRQGLI